VFSCVTVTNSHSRRWAVARTAHMCRYGRVFNVVGSVLASVDELHCLLGCSAVEGECSPSCIFEGSLEKVEGITTGVPRRDCAVGLDEDQQRYTRTPLLSVQIVS
jgi:hypothetical protein